MLAERPSPDGGEDLNNILNANEEEEEEDLQINNEKFSFENISCHNLSEVSSVPSPSTFSNDSKVVKN